MFLSLTVSQQIWSRHRAVNSRHCAGGKICMTCNLPFLSIPFQGLKCIHVIVCPSPLSISRTLSSSQTETLSAWNTNSLPSPPGGPGNHHVLSVSMNLPTQGITSMQNQTVSVFLWLAYFSLQAKALCPNSQHDHFCFTSTNVPPHIKGIFQLIFFRKSFLIVFLKWHLPQVQLGCFVVLLS